MSPSNNLQRPYVLLPSGGIIDLASPDWRSWNDRDLALGLSRTYRWGGHSRWPDALSVAQHSLTVLALRRQSGHVSEKLTLYELLHDAEEALIGFDCISPLKQFLGKPFRDLSSRLSAAIEVRYSLPKLTNAEYAAHKIADRTAAACEALHVAGWSREQISDKLQITEFPLDTDPLAATAETLGFAPWEPWPSNVAAAIWLAELQSA